MTVKENKAEKKVKKDIHMSNEEQERATENLDKFLKEFVKELPKDTKYSIENTEKSINVNIINKDLGYLIGYRGETLYALQNILSAVASKGINGRIRVILDIEGYKAKREKTLEDLAEKVAKTVIKTRKSIKNDPWLSYYYHYGRIGLNQIYYNN